MTKTAISSKGCRAVKDEQTAYCEGAKGKVILKDKLSKIKIAVKEKEHSKEGQSERRGLNQIFMIQQANQAFKKN